MGGRGRRRKKRGERGRRVKERGGEGKGAWREEKT